MPQIKPWIGQGKAGLRLKIKTLMPPPINKPIAKLSEKSKETSKSSFESSSTRKFTYS